MQTEVNWLHLAYSFAFVAIIMYLLHIPRWLIEATLVAQFVFLTVYTIFEVLFVEAEP